VATIGRINPHARRLRREATDAERRLWYHLRNRQLGGFKFRKQETIGSCVADFACVECRLVVEADGGQHSRTGRSFADRLSE
jgi:very-short-patch-repair endonuclease